MKPTFEVPGVTGWKKTWGLLGATSSKMVESYALAGGQEEEKVGG